MSPQFYGSISLEFASVGNIEKFFWASFSIFPRPTTAPKRAIFYRLFNLRRQIATAYNCNFSSTLQRSDKDLQITTDK